MRRMMSWCLGVVAAVGVVGAGIGFAGAQPPAPAQPTKPETEPDAKPAAPPQETKPAQPPAGDSKPGAADGKKEEVKPVKQTLPDGLEIEDLVVGQGKEVKTGAAVVANYRGTFKADGKEFDASEKHGGPATFFLGAVVKGWSEGVPGMRVGGKRKLTIPYQLAYGEHGRPPVIPPKSDLVFEIEIVDAVNTPEVATKDTVVGTGDAVGLTSVVTVFYRGTLKDGGTEFDSNMGQSPYTTAFNRVIPGWGVGMQGMKVGGKRTLTIPWKYGYPEGSPPKIPPKADLVFEVELVGVK